MTTMETRKLEYFRQVVTPFISKAAKVELVPWLACAGPSTWIALGYPALPVFAFEIDSRKVSAGKLVDDKNLLHDIATALGGRFRVYWKNSVGLALIVDERPAPQVNLVEALANAGAALIVGPRGTGKTTLLQHVISKAGCRVIVCDPKIQPLDGAKWPREAEVVGNGDFAAIAAKLAEVRARMERGGYGDRVLVVIDEYWISVKSPQGKEIVTDAWRMITLGREPQIDVILGSHSERVKGMAIDGEGDLKEALDVIRLTPGFGATITFAGKPVEHPAVHPGPFGTVQLARIFLTDDEVKLVQWAVYRNGGSFSLGKMEGVCVHTGFTPTSIRKLAEEWEAKGWLTPDSRDAKGVRIGRRVTPELLRLAGIKSPSLS